MEKILIIYFGDYWEATYRRRQSIAMELAKLPAIRQIVYIEKAISIVSLLKKLIGRSDLKSSSRWNRILKHGVRSYQNNIYIITPVLIIGRGLLGRLSIYIWDKLIARLSFNLIKRNGQNRSVIWVSIPDISAQLIRWIKKEFNDVLLCLDFSEDFRGLGSLNIKRNANKYRKIEKNEEALISNADIVFVNSEEYSQKYKFRYKDVFLLSNGISEVFLKHALEEENYHPLKDISHPIIGYTGSVHTELNIELLKYIAKSRKKWSFVLISNHIIYAIRKRLEELRNIHFFKEVPLKELPSYISDFDICINFYKKNEINDSRVSLKLLNYLAMGKPVVSTTTCGASKFAEVIYLADTAEDFLLKIEEGLNEMSKELKDKRKSIAAEHSWEKKVKNVYDLIFSKVKDKFNDGK